MSTDYTPTPGVLVTEGGGALTFAFRLLCCHELAQFRGARPVWEFWPPRQRLEYLFTCPQCRQWHLIRGPRGIARRGQG